MYAKFKLMSFTNYNEYVCAIEMFEFLYYYHSNPLKTSKYESLAGFPWSFTTITSTPWWSILVGRKAIQGTLQKNDTNAIELVHLSLPSLAEQDYILWSFDHVRKDK